MQSIFSDTRFICSVGLSSTLSTKKLLLSNSIRNIPQVLFTGATNVGKSSLINALVGSSELVKTSRRPGHTKTINIFETFNKFYLVDLPGYGKNSSEEQGQLFMEYVKHFSGDIRRIFLLRDMSKPFSSKDYDMIRLLEEERVVYQILLTKSDLFPDELSRFIQLKVLQDVRQFIQNKTTCCLPNVLITSSKLGGLDSLKSEILLSVGVIKKPLK